MFRDYFFRRVHPLYEVRSELAVSVRQIESGAWQSAYEFELCDSGLGTPFAGNFETREQAGRAGLLGLHLDLFRAKGWKPGKDKQRAVELLAMVEEELCPAQAVFKF